MSQDRKDHKEIVFGEEARQALVKGAKIMADTVGLSYGPKGTNLIIEKNYGRPVVTRDGVSIAREVYSQERDENMGMQLLLEASQTTNHVAGDGTTQTVLLTYELFNLGINKIRSGANPMDVKAEILNDSYKILANLETLSKDVVEGQLEQVATVSSGDPALGKLIAEAVETVGADGGLITEKAPISGVDRTYANGYFLQQGFTALDSGKKELNDPFVVVLSKSISSGSDVVTIIGKVAEQLPKNPQGHLTEPPRIAFFGEIEGDAYNIIVKNLQAGAIDATITKTPPMGDMGVQYLEDLAIYTGGKLIGAADNLSAIDSSYFGSADKVTCTNHETTVFGGHGNEEDLQKRKADLKDRIKIEEIDAIAEKLKDRLAKLENKIAIFRIGGATDTEKEEKEFRIEDAIQSTRAAAQNGIVTGGGITLLKLSQTESIGDIFISALQNVFKKLMENANLPADVKLAEALKSKDGYGFNLRENGDLVNLVEKGILDPTLVVEQVVENSASTAANAVSVGALITFTDKEE